MDPFRSDSKTHLFRFAGTNSYVDAYDEAVDLYFERDLQAWGKLLAFRERFLVRAWEKPLPDRLGRIDGGR